MSQLPHGEGTGELGLRATLLRGPLALQASWKQQPRISDRPHRPETARPGAHHPRPILSRPAPSAGSRTSQRGLRFRREGVEAAMAAPMAAPPPGSAPAPLHVPAAGRSGRPAAPFPSVSRGRGDGGRPAAGGGAGRGAGWARRGRTGGRTDGWTGGRAGRPGKGVSAGRSARSQPVCARQVSAPRRGRWRSWRSRTPSGRRPPASPCPAAPAAGAAVRGREGWGDARVGRWEGGVSTTGCKLPLQRLTLLLLKGWITRSCLKQTGCSRRCPRRQCQVRAVPVLYSRLPNSPPGLRAKTDFICHFISVVENKHRQMYFIVLLKCYKPRWTSLVFPTPLPMGLLLSQGYPYVLFCVSWASRRSFRSLLKPFFSSWNNPWHPWDCHIKVIPSSESA